MSNLFGPFRHIGMTIYGWLIPKHWPGTYKLSGKQIPLSIDLRATMPPAYIQPNEECVGFGVAGMLAADHISVEPMLLQRRARLYHGDPPDSGTVYTREGLWAAQDLCGVRRILRVRQNRRDVMDALANGRVVGFGFTAYQGLLDAGHKNRNPTAIVPMPAPADAKIGGHFGVLVGYDATHAIFRNAGGTTWGDKGHCYFPWSYIEDIDLTQDLWVITP